MTWPLRTACLVLVLGMMDSARTQRIEPKPQLLPDASEFRLELKEFTNAEIAADERCGGRALQTYACHAFVATLTNVGKHTVRLSKRECAEPELTVERQDSSAPGGWRIVSWSSWECLIRVGGWTNQRLRPRESIRYLFRLSGPQRDGANLPAGGHTLRAQWKLYGCTDDAAGGDCMAQLAKVEIPGRPPKVLEQTPVTVTSREIKVVAPPQPDFGVPQVSVSVKVRSVGADDPMGLRPDCKGASQRPECIVFHFSFFSKDEQSSILSYMGCEGIPVLIDYQNAWPWRGPRDEDWVSLGPLQGPFVCSANAWMELKITDKPAELDVPLSFYSRWLKMDPMMTPGTHMVRFRFHPNVCASSPDGSFCLDATGNPYHEVEINSWPTEVTIAP